jgi:hypothetical protein
MLRRPPVDVMQSCLVLQPVVRDVGVSVLETGRLPSDHPGL